MPERVPELRLALLHSLWWHSKSLRVPGQLACLAASIKLATVNKDQFKCTLPSTRLAVTLACAKRAASTYTQAARASC